MDPVCNGYEPVGSKASHMGFALLVLTTFSFLCLQTATIQCHRDNALCDEKSSVGPQLDQPRESKWAFA